MRITIRADAVEVEGYVNAVERLSKPLTDRLGQFYERICKGAFKRALDRANDVRILLNHDWNRDLGGTADGSLELNEDAIGLHARATITDPDVMAKAKNGDLVGWSFGFTDRKVNQGEEKGLTLREVQDLNLFEVSLLDKSKIPAYDGTLVSVRSADDSHAINIADVTEAEPLIIREDKPKEEPKEEPKEIDYTKYHNIINEMRGD